MFNNASNPAFGKGGNIIFLFGDPPLPMPYFRKHLRLRKTFSFHQHLAQKTNPVQVKKMMQKLSDSSLKIGLQISTISREFQQRFSVK
jgi:hypothetical protein